MRRYENLGNTIEVQVNGEYYIVANIVTVNRDDNESRAELMLRDKESGLWMELDKHLTSNADYKNVKVDITKDISSLIDSGYFDDDVENLSNIYNCLEGFSRTKEK